LAFHTLITRQGIPVVAIIAVAYVVTIDAIWVLFLYFLCADGNVTITIRTIGCEAFCAFSTVGGEPIPCVALQLEEEEEGYWWLAVD
jgi:hypothetical protein